MNKRDLIYNINNAARKKRNTELDLSRNKLAQLPSQIRKLTNITKLDLHDNQLKELPPEIGLLANLTKLDLRGNQLKELPPEIGTLTNVAELHLRDNQLKKLPAEIDRLTNLTELDLRDNQLNELPSEIGNLTNLTKLYLYNNQLTQLPPEIGKLTNLKRLHLDDNELVLLPLEIASLTKLEQNNVCEWGLKLKHNNFNVPKKILWKKDPQEIIKHILLASYRKGQIIDNELLVATRIQRELRKNEFTKIKKWLDIFRVKVYFAVDKDNPHIKLSRKSEEAIHQIKQHISNKHQDHISQVYDQKTANNLPIFI